MGRKTLPVLGAWILPHCCCCLDVLPICTYHHRNRVLLTYDKQFGVFKRQTSGKNMSCAGTHAWCFSVNGFNISPPSFSYLLGVCVRGYYIHRDQNNIPQGGCFECLVKRVTVIVFCNVDRPITLLGVSCVGLLSEFIVWERGKNPSRCSCFLRLQKRRTQFVKR